MYANQLQPGTLAQQAQDQLDPALIEAMLGGHRRTQQQAAIGRQFDNAGQLRQMADQQLQGRFAGTKDRPVYAAPNVLNLAANVMAHRKAQGLENDAETRLGNLGVEKDDAMRRFFDATRRYQGPRQTLPYMGAEGE